jgi:predicted exporter
VRVLGQARLWSLAVLLVVVAAWAWVLPRTHVDMSIAHFLPRAEDRRVAGLLRAMAEGDLASTMVVDVGDETSPEALLETTKRLRDRLKNAPTTRVVRSALDEQGQEAVGELLHRYPPTAFLPKEELAESAVRRRVAALKTELGGPLGPLVRALAPRDPIGAELGLFRALAEVQGKELTTRDGILLSGDGKHAFLFLTTKGDAFAADVQRQVIGDLTRAFEEVRTDKAQRLELSGVARYTIHSEEQIRGDINRIGTLSTVGILLLFLVMFRSARMLLLGLVPLFFGTMVAMIGSHFLFGSVHGLTLAFGASLLGVGIDYAEHYFTHFALEPERGAASVMRGVWPGLWMGALTTVAGLAGLAWADFPGAVQMAVFSSLAVAGALVGTRVLLPPWMPAEYKRHALPAHLQRAATVVIRVLAKRRSWAVLPLVLTVICGVGLRRVRFVDDMSALLAMDPDIKSEDERVRGRVTRSEPGRFAVVVGKDEAEALEALDLAHAELEGAQRDGLVEHFVPLGALVRSPRAQAESLAAAKASLPALRQALGDAGFRPELFAPYEAALAEASADKPLTLAALRDSPLGALVSPLSPTVAGQQAFVLPLGGVQSIEKLRARVPHAAIVDERAMLDETYAHVHQRVLSLIVLGLVFVFALLFLRYRSLRITVAAMVPALLAATCTVACFGWLGVPLNIMHAIGLSLVLSMGVDYGIFVIEGRASEDEAARSIVSVLTATITTILSFGLLALSGNPALRALGMTTAIGMTASFVLCPGALVLLALGRKQP